MFLQRAWTVFWKEWAAKHEYEEMKEGIWLELDLALLREKMKGDWTEKHRNVARKLLAGCRRDFSTFIGRMTVSVKLVTKRKAQKSTGSTIAHNGTRSDGRFQEPTANGSRKRGFQRKSGSGKGELLRTLFLNANGTGPLQHEKVGIREAQELGHTSRGLHGPCHHGRFFLLGKVGKWRACGWAVVQLDYDEEMGPLHGMYVSMEAELEVQRAIKTAELTAFSMPSQESDWTHQGVC